MKQHTFFTLLLLTSVSLAGFAQQMGNVTYKNKVRLPSANIYVGFQDQDDYQISVKGLSNVKATDYVAIFSLTQVGKTVKEVNSLIDARIQQVEQQLKQQTGLQLHVDIISFVPMYEYEVEKKIFSRKTYHEIPKGFEIKKNIHIRYKNPKLLHQILSICAASQIYDLVKVDYFVANLSKVKADLIAKARVFLQQKLANYQAVLGNEITTYKKRLKDGFKVMYPIESYHSYKAYSSSSLNTRKSSRVNQVNKSRTMYYQPIVDKEFDFVINPVVVTPVVQVMYQLNLSLHKFKKPKATTQTPVPKEYMLITPTGEIKKLEIKK